MSELIMRAQVSALVQDDMTSAMTMSAMTEQHAEASEKSPHVAVALTMCADSRSRETLL